MSISHFSSSADVEASPRLAIIGGSGLYEMPGLVETKILDLDTPFGKPSAPLVVGMLAGQRVAFLARHGLGHHIMPSEVPYRANIYALKMLGVEQVISISACGSLREDYTPGDIVIPDQVLDYTHHRTRTFFGEGLVAHVSVADPFCPDLSQQLYLAVKSAGAITHRGGAFIVIEGPRFSTKAESNTYRSWGMSIIGMTACPEVFLAREAELCYATMAHVTDYDVWHVSEEPVTVEMVIQTLNRNTQIAQEAIRHLVHGLTSLVELRAGSVQVCDCSRALASAIITHPDAIPTATREKLGVLVSKYLS